MEVVEVPIDELIEDSNNARKHDARNLKAIQGSLERFGQVEALVVRAGSNIVVGGNGRLTAMRALGWRTAQIVRVDLDDNRAKALGVALNRTAELATWDPEQLAKTLEALVDAGDSIQDLEAIGFDMSELEKISVSAYERSVPQREIVEDEVPETPKDPVTRLGDVWTLGQHTLVCGDALEQNQSDIETVVSDPPYGTSYQSNRRKDKHDPIAGDEDLLLWACGLEAKYSKYIWCRWNNLKAAPQPKSLITWIKNVWSMGDLEHEHARQTEIALFYSGPNHRWVNGRPVDIVNHSRTGNEHHPTQKPVSLFAELVQWTEGVIFDPFLGSGTTLIAAEQLDRVCYGIEISPAYCDIVVERWQNLTGGKARRVRK